MKILSGKQVSNSLREALTREVSSFKNSHGRPPGLAVVLVGEDPASQVYVAAKAKACGAVGIESFERRIAQNTSQSDVIEVVQKLNKDPVVDGILVQLPLPKALKENEILKHLDPLKDADALTIENLGLFFAGNARVASCTPCGIMEILKYYDINVAGMNAVVVGRSNIVGKPMAQLLIQANATVTVCHSKTNNVSEFTSKADLVVVAAGVPEFLGKDDFKKDAVIIDVGIHRNQTTDGKTKLCGDVRFGELEGHVQAVTPVPGGVGPMTITMLLSNTLKLAKLHV